jgi:alpha-1,3-mannosyltransferase
MALDRPSTPQLHSSSKSGPQEDDPRRRHPNSLNAAVDFYFRHWSPILLAIELILNMYFLHHGPLHPIDYPTYLIQARQVRLGERDYVRIHGPTGPLVYPGGHVIIFGIFERLFGVKGDIDWNGYFPAQCIFLIVQLLHTYVFPRE